MKNKKTPHTFFFSRIFKREEKNGISFPRSPALLQFAFYIASCSALQCCSTIHLENRETSLRLVFSSRLDRFLLFFFFCYRWHSLMILVSSNLLCFLLLSQSPHFFFFFLTEHYDFLLYTCHRKQRTCLHMCMIVSKNSKKRKTMIDQRHYLFLLFSLYY